jgi:hypothetical protein
MPKPQPTTRRVRNPNPRNRPGRRPAPRRAKRGPRRHLGLVLSLPFLALFAVIVLMLASGIRTELSGYLGFGRAFQRPVARVNLQSDFEDANAYFDGTDDSSFVGIAPCSSENTALGCIPNGTTGPSDGVTVSYAVAGDPGQALILTEYQGVSGRSNCDGYLDVAGTLMSPVLGESTVGQWTFSFPVSSPAQCDASAVPSVTLTPA